MYQDGPRLELQQKTYVVIGEAVRSRGRFIIWHSEQTKLTTLLEQNGHFYMTNCIKFPCARAVHLMTTVMRLA